MNKLLVLATLAAAACDGSISGDPGIDEAAILQKTTPPAPPYVAWQFQGCLDVDHRNGLIAALQAVNAHWFAGSAAAQTASLSLCINGDERGGLFASGSSDAGRRATLANLSIRPTSRAYTFMIGSRQIAIVGAYQWRTFGGPLTFDDNGIAGPNQRYQFTGYEMTITQFTPPIAEYRYGVYDTQTGKANGIVYLDSLFITGAGTLARHVETPQTSPLSSSDPYVQTVINASENFIATPTGIDHTSIIPLYDSTISIDFDLAPSLKGWPMPFDLVRMDSSGNLLASGGDLIF